MKSILVFSLGLTLALSAPVLARDLGEIRQSGTIRLATEGATPPFNYFEGEKLTGFDVDLGTALGKQMGLSVEWVALPFDFLLVGLDQSRYDAVVAGHGITEERLKAVDFSDPYVCSGAAIVSMEGGAKTVADLAGKIIGVQVGTTYLEAVSALPGVGEVKTFPKDTDAQQNLVSGRTDVWVSDKLTAIDAQNKNPEAGLQIGDYLYQERYGIAIKKGNAELLAAVNDALAAALAEGGYAKISQQYFNSDIRCP